ncbi:MAG: type II toxin-antitoxin system Phd/YefM family antitoxin [Chitinispirillia bacterium]|jgi:antitoxin (DNA-binding transcriptional repressor) of toxin-antitoxin stability system
MTIYTYSEARQKFSTVLDRAKIEGNVQIVRKDGQIFLITPITNQNKSPLNVKGINSNITTNEIVSVIREFRER